MNRAVETIEGSIAMSYLESDWLGLVWSDWIPLKTNQKVRKIIPPSQGVYRIRSQGYQGIIYIGQTSNLKRRTATLARHSYNTIIPFNDPHTAAPNLWVWRKENGFNYEVSVSTTEISRQNREAFECWLLWQYRLEQGQSTLCNHGRFHKDYKKSRNRNSQIRGGKLRVNEERNPSGEQSSKPLHSKGKPLSRNWMGLEWSPIKPLTQRENIPRASGLYKIILEKDVVYIGETKNLVDRLRSHNRRFKDHQYSLIALDRPSLPHQRNELENDLIGGFYQLCGQAPERQFKRKKIKVVKLLKLE